MYSPKNRRLHKRRADGQTDVANDKKQPKTIACEAYEYCFAMQECTLKIVFVGIKPG